MKTGFKRLLGIICLLMLLGPVAIHAKCKCGKPKEDKRMEKIYLNPEEIDIVNKQILVKVADKTHPALALYTDKEGIYILARRRQGRCSEEQWECDRCGGCSSLYNWDCDWCGEEN